MQKSRFTDRLIMDALERVEAGLSFPEHESFELALSRFTSAAPSTAGWTPQ